MKLNLDDFFHYKAAGSTLNTEVIAGFSTFAAMAYIICVQPTLLSGQLSGTATGMPFGALLTTTCLAAGIGSLLMGLYANFPIGQAPGMGSNFFFVFSLMSGCAAVTGGKIGDPVVWQTALGVVLLSGVIFLLLSCTNLREKMINSLSLSLQNGIVAGIGLFIALLGLQNGGIIAIENNHLTLHGSFSDSGVLVFYAGLILITALHTARVKGGILIGILFSALIAFLLGKITLTGIVGLPENPMPVVLKADFTTVFKYFFTLLPLIFICLFMDLFDTMGTLLGVGSYAGFIKDGKIKGAERVYTADAAATVTGALCGHSTVTSYVESSAGVEAGGRTGLTAVVVGICFFLAMFFSPLVTAIAGYAPVTSSALLIVGVMMMQAAVRIQWDDHTEAVPAFLILAGIPFSYSIIGGIAIGLITYPIVKICSGRGKELNWFAYASAIFLALYVILLKK